MISGPLAAALAAALALAPLPAPSDRSVAPGSIEHVPIARSSATSPGGHVPSFIPAPASDSPQPEGPAPAPKADRGCHGSAPCRRLIALGATAGGLGLVAIVSGAALLARPVAVDPDDPTTLVTHRPAGAALLAIGAGLATTWLLTLLAARKAGRNAQRLQAAAPAP